MEQKQEQPIIWRNLLNMILSHLVAVYGLFFVVPYLKWQTIVFSLLMYEATAFGSTAGAHRLWSHKAFKAKAPLRIILVICYLFVGWYPISWWVRDHRLHHKYTDTDADPYNSKRGFLFSHVAWIVREPHPEVKRRLQEIDTSDLDKDPIVSFQERHFRLLNVLFWQVIPTAVPVLCWGEPFLNAYIVNIVRCVAVWNGIWSINSFAHMFGTHPYNRDMSPVENLLVSVFSSGEGWHNFHHCFPYDYKAQELGRYSANFSTALIDFFALLGWAYDLKQAPKESVLNLAKRHGDGTHPQFVKS